MAVDGTGGYTALVTEGCAAAILCGYAGMLTEDYNERMMNIPDLRGFPKTEVIIQAGHRDNFDHQIRQTGVKLVVVNTKDELIAGRCQAVCVNGFSFFTHIGVKAWRISSSCI